MKGKKFFKKTLAYILTVMLILPTFTGIMPFTANATDEPEPPPVVTVDGVDILLNAGTSSSVLAGELEDELRLALIRLLQEDPKYANLVLDPDTINIMLNNVDIDTSDLSKWHIYDHYDAGYYGNATQATWESKWDSEKTGEWGDRTIVQDLGRRPFYSNATAKEKATAIKLADWLNQGTMYEPNSTWISTSTNTTSAGKNAKALGRFDQHISVGEENGVSAINFVGYAKEAYTDYMLFHCESAEKKEVAFSVNSSNVNLHTLSGVGFLFNTELYNKTTDNNKLYIKGYILYYKFTVKSSGAGAAPPDSVSVYSIDMPMDTFHGSHGTSATNNMFSISSPNKPTQITTGVTTNNLVWSDELNIKLTIATDSIVVEHQKITNGSADSIYSTVLEATGLSKLSGNSFGPFADYAGHGCMDASQFTFANIQMAYVDQSDNIFDVVSGANFGQDSELFFVDLTDKDTNRVLKTGDGADNTQIDNAASYMKSRKIRYITNNKNDLLADSSSNPLLGGTLDAAGNTDRGETLTAETDITKLADETARAILDQLLGPKPVYDNWKMTEPIANFSLVDANENGSTVKEVKKVVDIDNNKEKTVYAYDVHSTPSGKGRVDSDENLYQRVIVEYNYTITFPDTISPAEAAALVTKLGTGWTAITDTSGKTIGAKRASFTEANSKLFDITDEWPVGTYTVTLVVKDAARENEIEDFEEDDEYLGQESKPAKTTFTIVEDIVSPHVETVTIGDTGAISFEVSDKDGFGIKDYTVELTPIVDGVPDTANKIPTSKDFTKKETADSKSKIVDVDVEFDDDIPNGNYLITITVTDLANNTTTITVPYIDYKNGDLCEFKDDGDYVIESGDSQSAEDGKIEIADAWIGNSITMTGDFGDDRETTINMYIPKLTSPVEVIMNKDGGTDWGTTTKPTIVLVNENDLTDVITINSDGKFDIPNDGTVYNVCVSDGTTKTPTGEKVSSADLEATLDFYTVNYSIEYEGNATGGTISATYDSNSISNGAVVLGGKDLVITVDTSLVSGANAYTYEWSGTVGDDDTVISGGNNPITITVSDTTNAVYTITGVDYLITATAENLDDLQVGVTVEDAKIIFTLSDDSAETYAGVIDPAKFTVGNLPAGLTAGTAVRTGDNTVEIIITGTPTTAVTDKLLTIPATIPGANVVNADGNVAVTSNISLIVAKGNPDALDIGTADVTVNGGSDGAITGLDDGTVYEYRLATDDPNAPYTTATADADGKITGLPAGDYDVREKATDDYEAGNNTLVTINEPGQVILTVNKDGTPYDEKEIILKNKDTDTIVDFVDVTDGKAIFKVPAGEYDIYDGNTLIGNIELSGPDDATETLNYYTVTYNVVCNGVDGTDASISATYGDDEIESGDVVLASDGKELIITVTDESGANAYIYGWYDNINDEDCDLSNKTLTTDALAEKIDVTCTVTGVDYVIAASKNGLDNLKVGQNVPADAKIIFTLTGEDYKGTITDTDFTSAITNLPNGLSIGTVTRKDNNTVEVAITGTPTTATTAPITLNRPATIPGATNVVDTVGDVTVTGTISLTVAKGDREDLDIGTADVTVNGGSDGAITGLNPGTVYEYRLATDDPNAPYTTATADADGKITGLPAGDYEVREKATDDYEASNNTPVTINEPGQIILTVNKDGEEYNGKTLTLKKSGTTDTTVTVTDGKTIFKVPAGEYDIYDESGKIGTIVLLGTDEPNFGDATETLNYYTITYNVEFDGIDGTDASISATYGDDEIESGDVVLASDGKELIITVTDESGANAYIYSWGDGSNETSNERTINPLESEVDVTCTVIGLNYFIEATAVNLDDLQVGVSVTVDDDAKIIFTLTGSTYEAIVIDDDFIADINDSLPTGLSVEKVNRKDDNTVEVIITGTPTEAIENKPLATIPELIPGANVVDADGNVAVTGNISLTVAKGSPNDLDIGTADVTVNGGSDGAITGLNPGTVYEYKLSTDDDYTDATADADGKITGLPAGTYNVREKATDDYEAGSKATVIINEPGQVILTVNKDSEEYNGKTLTLKKSGTPDTTVTVTDGKAIFKVPAGEYDIYDGNTLIGNIELSGPDDATETLNYYTVTYNVVCNGVDGTDASISATYGDDEIESGDVVLASDGKELIITVTDESGANAYIYGWYDNINDEDCDVSNNTLTIDELLGKADVTCTVTGVSYGITVTAEGLGDLQADVPVTGAKIIFTLNGGEYGDNDIIDLTKFTVGNLPEGLTAGTPVRLDDNTVIVPVTGKPKTAISKPINLTVPASIPGENNVAGASGDVGVTGTVSLIVKERGTYSVRGDVVNENGGELFGAIVSIVLKGSTIDSTATDSNGAFIFYNIPSDTYNLVIEFTDEKGVTTVTQIVKVIGDTTVGTITMPVGGKTTIFEHELSDENEVKVNAVGSLEQVYANVNGNTDDIHGVTVDDMTLVDEYAGYVEVVLVAKDVDWAIPEHVSQSTDVRNRIERDKMIFTHEFDLSAFKYAHADAQNIERSTATETSLKRINNLVQIYIPIPESLLDKTDSIAIYRHHDGQVERIPKSPEMLNSYGECFDIVDNMLILYVQQFSVYAIAITEPPSPPSPYYPTYPANPYYPYYPQYPADNSGSNNGYTVSVGFDANGGYGGKSYDTTHGGSYMLPNNTFTRDGYTFAGWKINNSGQTIAPGRYVGIDGNITLYAQWTLINSVITAPADNGKSSANSAEPKTGEKVTVTIEPDAGFELDTLTITDMDGNEIAYKDNKDGTYTYTHPAGTAKVNATFKRLPAVDGSNVSSILITDDHIAYVQGRGENMFFPDANMTRAEAAQMFCNLLRNKDVAVTVTFPDVPDSAWYAKAVNTLASMGIIVGFPDGNFYPDENITRAQFTAIVVRFAKVATASVPFKDVPETHWAYDYISTASNFGWLNWINDDNFFPENNIERAEAVAIVNRMLRRYPDKDYINNNQELIRYSDTPETHWAFYEIIEASYAHEYARKIDNSEIWKEILGKFSITH